MKKALNAWSVNGNESFSQMFAHLSEAGFDAVELNLDGAGHSNHSLFMDTTEEELFTIREEAAKAGLEIVGVSCSMYTGQLGSLDAAVREEGKNLVRKQLFLAKNLGADNILVPPGADIAGGDSIKTAYEMVEKSLTELKPEIEASGVCVALENIWNGFFTSPFDMARMVDKLDSPYIKAYYDVGNTVAFSDTVSWIEILENRINRIHIKGFKCNGGEFGRLNTGGDFCDLPDSDINWEAVMAMLHKIGYDGYITGEVFPNKAYATDMDFYKEVSGWMSDIIK